MRTFNTALIVIGIVSLVVLGAVGLGGAVFPSLFLTLGDLLAGPLAYLVEAPWGKLLAPS